MTIVSVFGKNIEMKKDIRKIEFYSYLDKDLKQIESNLTPELFDNVTLLMRDYEGSENDLIWAYDENTNDGVLFVGQWNDGIV